MDSQTRFALTAMYRHALIFSVVLFLAGCTNREPAGLPFVEIENSLRPMAKALEPTKPGEWLSVHQEDGQTFAQYLGLKPKPRSQGLTTIYLVLLGDFSPEQKKVLEISEEYLGLFYQSPVRLIHELPGEVVPDEGRRIHPSWETPQIRTSYVLDQLLRPDRPDDALAYLCFTSSDLCSHATENYVLGEARTWERLGVWSIYRNGDPSESATAFRQCLRRTMHIATHETGHILAMKHCTAFQCNMNGANSPTETDRHPLHFCPVCLRKLIWNLDADPDAYLAALQEFCKNQEFDDESRWYAEARKRLMESQDR